MKALAVNSLAAGMRINKARLSEIVLLLLFKALLEATYILFVSPNYVYSGFILEPNGIKYDTTLGVADYEGFRCGICCPYRPFDILENRALDIWEVPLIVMEGTLFGYRGLSPGDGLKTVQRMVEAVERYRGVLVVLWHNSSTSRKIRGPLKYISGY